MKKVTITYKGVQEFRGTVTFVTDKVFYHKSYGYKEIGYLPEGSKRKKWFPIDGKLDEVNDYTETEVEIV